MPVSGTSALLWVFVARRPKCRTPYLLCHFESAQSAKPVKMARWIHTDVPTLLLPQTARGALDSQANRSMPFLRFQTAFYCLILLPIAPTNRNLTELHCCPLTLSVPDRNSHHRTNDKRPPRAFPPFSAAQTAIDCPHTSAYHDSRHHTPGDQSILTKACLLPASRLLSIACHSQDPAPQHPTLPPNINKPRHAVLTLHNNGLRYGASPQSFRNLPTLCLSSPQK